MYRLEQGLVIPTKPKAKPVNRATPDTGINCTNHLRQDFDQKAPDLVWVSDITFIKINNVWYYLCVVIDLFSRKVIGWCLSCKSDANLTCSTFKKAYQSRNINGGLVFHSDRGTQYTASAFRRLLDSLNVVQSFSKKGYPYDNAVCESFFKTIKEECTKRKTYHSADELQKDVFEYIESFYNNKRPHSYLNNMTPNEFEAEYAKRQKE